MDEHEREALKAEYRLEMRAHIDSYFRETGTLAQGKSRGDIVREIRVLVEGHIADFIRTDGPLTPRQQERVDLLREVHEEALRGDGN